jgi:hypothetical protein
MPPTRCRASRTAALRSTRRRQDTLLTTCCVAHAKVRQPPPAWGQTQTQTQTTESSAEWTNRREEAELPSTRVAADGDARATVDAQQQASIPGGSWGAGLEPSGPANGTASRALEAKQEECDQLAHELARTRSASCVAWGSIHGPSMGHPLGAIHGPPSGGSGGSSYSRMRACVHAHKIRTPPPHRSSGLESAERENAVLRSAAVHRDRSASSVVACMARIKADEEPLVGL